MLIPMQRGDPVSGFYRPSAVRMLEIRGGGFCPRCAPDNLSFLISKVAPAAVAVAPAAACGPGAAAPLRSLAGGVPSNPTHKNSQSTAFADQ